MPMGRFLGSINVCIVACYMHSGLSGIEKRLCKACKTLFCLDFRALQNVWSLLNIVEAGGCRISAHSVVGRYAGLKRVRRQLLLVGGAVVQIYV